MGEIHQTVAPSPKRIADVTHLKKPPRKNVVAKIISPLIPLPDSVGVFCLLQSYVDVPDTTHGFDQANAKGILQLASQMANVHLCFVSLL